MVLNHEEVGEGTDDGTNVRHDPRDPKEVAASAESFLTKSSDECKKQTILKIRRFSQTHLITHKCMYSRREVSCRIDGTSSIEGEADVHCGKAKANERCYETRINFHVFPICHRKDYHQENRCPQGLVHH